MKLLLGRLHLLGALLVASTFLGAGSAQALPALQLGPGAGGWTYDLSTQTWVTTGNPVQLVATANATMADGGNGAYAWEAPSSTKIAYLVVSAVPKQTDPPGGDVFDITLMNDAVDITLSNFIAAGYGAPPVSDPNDLAPHSIFSTYYEVYAFEFDEGLTMISNTQPGGTGTGMGYLEYLDVEINSLGDEVTGLHFDLYTLDSADQVMKFAPFSHDAEFALVPEPRAALLFGVGGLIAGMVLRRRR